MGGSNVCQAQIHFNDEKATESKVLLDKLPRKEKCFNSSPNLNSQHKSVMSGKWSSERQQAK